MNFKFSPIKNTFIIAFLLIVFTSITGCEEECPEINIDDLNAFYFQFKTSGNNAFDLSELDSIYMVRYLDVIPDSFSFPQDTFSFDNAVFNFNNHTIRLSQGQPDFDGIPPPYFPDYKYKILSENQDFEFRIEQIELLGSYIGECDYVNSKKSLVFDGDSLDFIAGVDEFIILEKP